MLVRKTILNHALYKPLLNQRKFNYAQHFVKEGKQRVVGGWLFFAAAGVLGMIVLGGYTRLTHSGLSMTDWKPYTARYPKNDEEWNEEFQKYKNCIEFQTVNKEISVEQFKPIFRVQFVHRQMGQYLGLYFMVPFAFFIKKGYITPLLRNRLFGILGLGALQGGIGWWMVKSGLKEKPEYQSRPRVSPYRLMTHLMMATTLYAALIWHAFSLVIKPIAISQTDTVKIQYLRKIRIIGIVLIKCLILNIFSGALVAGIGAGQVYNTWPLMNGKFLPPNAFERTPVWRNFFENRSLVQWNHRMMAYITQSVGIYLMYTILKRKVHTPASFAGVLTFFLINYQAVSGIITLLHLVPPEKANAHQMSAIITLTSALLLVYLARVPKFPITPP